MRILRAAHLGMCFGVRDAIALASEHADAGPLTILGDLVHNPTVLNALAAKGIAVAQDSADVRTPTVMVTAHGTSERTLAQTRALGLTVVEATCPLVRVAHRAVAALARDGYHIVIVGQRDHVEVRGLTDDLDCFDVVLDEEDVLALEAHPRIGVAAQTTQAIEKVRHMVALIRGDSRSRRCASSTRSASPPRTASPRQSRWRARPTSSSSSAAIEQQHARAGQDLRALLCARASRRDRGGRPRRVVRCCADRGTHGRHLDARRRHRSRRGADPFFTALKQAIPGYSERTNDSSLPRHSADSHDISPASEQWPREYRG